MFIKNAGGLNYCKLHLGEGRFQVYTVPANTAPTVDAVKRLGTLHSEKAKGDCFRLTTGDKDSNWRIYNVIEAIEGAKEDAPEPTPEAEPAAPAPAPLLDAPLTYRSKTVSPPNAMFPYHHVPRAYICERCGKEIPAATRIYLKDGKVSSSGNTLPHSPFAKCIKGGPYSKWECGTCPKTAPVPEPEPAPVVEEPAKGLAGVPYITPTQVEENLAAPAAPIIPVQAPNLPVEPTLAPTPATTIRPLPALSLIVPLSADLERISAATAEEFSDEFVRGATYLFCRVLRGGV